MTAARCPAGESRWTVSGPARPPARRRQTSRTTPAVSPRVRAARRCSRPGPASPAMGTSRTVSIGENDHDRWWRSVNALARVVRLPSFSSTRRPRFVTRPPHGKSWNSQPKPIPWLHHEPTGPPSRSTATNLRVPTEVPSVSIPHGYPRVQPRCAPVSQVGAAGVGSCLYAGADSPVGAEERVDAC